MATQTTKKPTGDVVVNGKVVTKSKKAKAHLTMKQSEIDALIEEKQRGIK